MSERLSTQVRQWLALEAFDSPKLEINTIVQGKIITVGRIPSMREAALIRNLLAERFIAAEMVRPLEHDSGDWSVVGVAY